MAINPAFNPAYLGLQGRDNLGGLKQNILLAPKNWFTNIAPADAYPNDATFTGTLTQIEDTVKISGDHTFSVGKGFIQLYTTFDTSQLEQTANEVVDKTGKEIALDGFYPGDEVGVLALLSIIENFDCIVLAKALDASPTAPYYQLGEEELWARFSGTFGTKTPTGDRKGTAFKVKSYQARIKLYYGAVTLQA